MSLYAVEYRAGTAFVEATDPAKGIKAVKDKGGKSDRFAARATQQTGGVVEPTGPVLTEDVQNYQPIKLEWRSASGQPTERKWWWATMAGSTLQGSGSTPGDALASLGRLIDLA